MAQVQCRAVYGIFSEDPRLPQVFSFCWLARCDLVLQYAPTALPSFSQESVEEPPQGEGRVVTLRAQIFQLGYLGV